MTSGSSSEKPWTAGSSSKKWIMCSIVQSGQSIKLFYVHMVFLLFNCIPLNTPKPMKAWTNNQIRLKIYKLEWYLHHQKMAEMYENKLLTKTINSSKSSWSRPCIISTIGKLHKAIL